jgi:hypothetical protein
MKAGNSDSQDKGCHALKGQIFSMDLILATFIFILVFGVLIASWNSMLDNSIDYSERKDMEMYANVISDLLVSGGGYPGDWEDRPADEVHTIGIAGPDRVINEQKLAALLALDYDDAREIMKVGAYHFHFRLSGAGLETGQPLDSDFGFSAFSRRLVLYRGEPDSVEVLIWRYA